MQAIFSNFLESIGDILDGAIKTNDSEYFYQLKEIIILGNLLSGFIWE